jgi:cell division ATPase FtsA
MAGAAMELRRRVANSISSALVDEATNLIQHFKVDPQEVRNYFIQPEGLAAVKAFLESPHAEQRTYAIVDVGAGTTEVSFFFNGRMMTELGQPFRPNYLADSTEAVGGSKIDVELADQWACSVEEAKRRKESDPYQTPTVSAVHEICLQYQRTCAEVVNSRRLSSPHDMRFKLFIIGGGGRLHCLREALMRSGLAKHFRLELWLKLKPPKRLKGCAEIEEDYDFFANACGLASSIGWNITRQVRSQQWPRSLPDFLCEDQIETSSIRSKVMTQPEMDLCRK